MRHPACGIIGLPNDSTRCLAFALCAAVHARGRPAQPLLQLAQHRVVPGDGGRLREGDRHARSRSCRRRPAKCSRRSRPSAPIPKGDIWWAGAADNYLQAAEEGLLDDYRSPNVAQLYDWARRISDVSKNRVVRRLRRHHRARLQHRDCMAKQEAAGAQVLEGPRQSRATRARVMLGNPNSSGTAYLMLATLVQVFGEDEAFRYMRGVNANVNQYARSGIGPMTAVTRGEVCARQHGAPRRDQRDRARLSGRAGAAVRRRRLRGRLGGDHQGRAQSRRREEVRRLGADRRRRRRSVSTSRSTRSRPIAASPLPPQVPKLTDIKVIDYDFAKYGVERDAQASARALGKRNQRRAALTLPRPTHRRPAREPSAARSAVDRRRRGRIPASCPGMRCRTRCSASAGCAISRARTTRRRSCRRCRVRPARGCCRSALLIAAAACCCPRASRDGVRATGADCARRAGFVYLFAQGFAIGPRGCRIRVARRVLGTLAGGQYGMGLGATLVATAFAMLFALGLAERGYFKGDAFVAGSVVAVGAAGRARSRSSRCSRS